MNEHSERTAVPTPRYALLLANPKARRGASNAVDAARQTLESGGLTVTVELPEHVEVDCVVLAGGDGTLNAGVSALQRIQVPFGIIPLGAGNDLARTLGLPESASAAAHIIVEGHHQAIDVATVNGRPFFDVASMGLSARLADRLDANLNRRWGRLACAFTGMRVLIEARPFRAEIIDRSGRRQVKTLQIAFGNGRHYGGGNVVKQTAAIADGDLITRTPARFKVHPAAVRVYTRRSKAEAQGERG